MNKGLNIGGTSLFEAHRQAVQNVRAEGRRCVNEGACLAVLAVGFDHFEEIVGRAGELAAEEALGQLLRSVQVHCGRERDHVMRLSSDTIIAICPKTLPAGARHIAAQIREAAEQIALLADGCPVTVSIGIATAAPVGEEAAEELLARAERSLETARESGGNRIIGAAPAPPTRAPSSLGALAASMLAKRQAAANRRQGD